MGLPFHNVFEKIDKELSAVENRVYGRLSSRERTTLQPVAGARTAGNSLLNVRLARQQEEVNRLKGTMHEKELALECNALQLQRATDDLMRLERENAALRAALSDAQSHAAAVQREQERRDNEMRFLKAELDYRLGQADELRGQQEETVAQLTEKEEENARLLGRLKELENEREELTSKLQLAGLRHRTLYAGDARLCRHRRGVLARLLSWLSKPILVVGNSHE